MRVVAAAERARSMSKAGKVLGGASRVLNKANPLYTFNENRRKGMGVEENVVRTAAATATANAFGAAGSAACGPACGVGAAYLGDKAGDFAGGVVYGLVDTTFQHTVDPLAGAVGDGLKSAGRFIGGLAG
jgi:hypothetical protein